MPAEKNTSIGTCPCPFKGCETVTSVFKFRGRSDNAARHRYAGKLYCVCPTHGRIESQEWILENARIETSAISEAGPPAPVDDQSSSSAPAASAASSGRSEPRSVATAPAAARARERWGFFE